MFLFPTLHCQRELNNLVMFPLAWPLDSFVEYYISLSDLLQYTNAVRGH